MTPLEHAEQIKRLALAYSNASHDYGAMHPDDESNADAFSRTHNCKMALHAAIDSLSQRCAAEESRAEIAEQEHVSAAEERDFLRERLAAAEAKLAEAEADAARYRCLRKLARQETAYDRYGDGGYWIIGVFSNDNRLSFDAAIDQAMEGDRHG